LYLNLKRPVAGYVNICPASVSSKKKDIQTALSTLKHEILHALGFSAGLYAFFLDENGKPLTDRDKHTGKPPFNNEIKMYEPSERVIKKIVRTNWVVSGGTINRNVTMVVTPKVVKEVRKHFNCDSLEGAELEDQGEVGTKLTHWEKRVFEVSKYLQIVFEFHFFFSFLFNI
jgi:leishmanolysin-like peptidase